jgi:hypothetical protein
MYKSKLLDPDFSPTTLQNKVLFDILYYFSRRGTEGLASMTKEFFQVK